MISILTNLDGSRESYPVTGTSVLFYYLINRFKLPQKSRFRSGNAHFPQRIDNCEKLAKTVANHRMLGEFSPIGCPETDRIYAQLPAGINSTRKVKVLRH